jgi:hypothetical protein
MMITTTILDEPLEIPQLPTAYHINTSSENIGIGYFLGGDRNKNSVWKDLRAFGDGPKDNTPGRCGVATLRTQ